MIRFAAAVLSGLACLPLQAGAGCAADMPRPEAPRFAAPARIQADRPRAPGGAAAAMIQERYSYYGAYQYPVPFGYGYGYAPVRSRGFEYGYNGPRYAWVAPDWYDGPAFGYNAW